MLETLELITGEFHIVATWSWSELAITVAVTKSG